VLERHVSTQCVDYQTCSCACSHTKKLWCCTLFRLHLWEIMWQTRFDMFKVTHWHDFVSQKVYRQPSFSVWTRAWIRLVVDTLRGNMSVELKHRKLWDKLYTDTSSHEKICMRTRPCKSKLRRGTFFSQWIHITVLRVGRTNDLWHDFVCEKLHTYTSSYVKICTWRRPRKSK